METMTGIPAKDWQTGKAWMIQDREKGNGKVKAGEAQPAL
jgi:hypothetical protein